MPLFLAEFAGDAEAVCPRGAAAARARSGPRTWASRSRAAVEFEFFVFDETPAFGAREGLSRPEAITPGFFGYSVLRSGVHADFYHELLRHCDADGYARSRACTPRPARACSRRRSASTMRCEAADKAALFKTFTKILAQKRGWMATFMAKWSRDWPGQSRPSAHVARSTAKGKGVFHDAKQAARHVGQDALVRRRAAGADARAARHGRLHGQQLHAPHPRLLGADRMRAGASRTAPARCASFRARKRAQRVEYRIAAADINPYIALAAAIGSGLWGIENKIEPGRAVEGNAYAAEVSEGARACRARSGRRRERLKRIEGGARACSAMPSSSITPRRANGRSASSASAITDWELARYFEII